MSSGTFAVTGRGSSLESMQALRKAAHFASVRTIPSSPSSPAVGICSLLETNRETRPSPRIQIDLVGCANVLDLAQIMAAQTGSPDTSTENTPSP
jgi:hypothetical protein